MGKNFDIKINGKKIKALTGQTVLEVARKNSFSIPTLCYHSDLKPNANCRLCLVETKNGDKVQIVTACSTNVWPQMEVKLDTPKVKKVRKLNLQLLLSDHIKKCPKCNWSDNCQLSKLAEEFGIKESNFPERRRRAKIDNKCPSISWDSSKCVECGNCISACKEITDLDIIGSKYRSHSIIFGPKGGKSFLNTNCVYCGQCIIHCPAGSLQEKSEVDVVTKLLDKRGKNVLIAQFAPSARYSIGELFGAEIGSNLEARLVTALKNIGFDYIFDVNTGADITTIEEAAELLERIETKKDMPMFTSCCPAWVRYVEIFHHDLIPHLATTASPAHCLANAVKYYFAQKIKVNPRRIKIVEIMPCVAKKNEAKISETQKSFGPEIDCVLTVREAAELLKSKNIDLLKLKDGSFDSPLGESSGAATIYGSSGGVMESALRTMASKLSKTDMPRLEFCDVRGVAGIKESSVEIGGEVLEVAIVSGLSNAAKLIKDIKSGTKRYNYVEVMACPGGCLGGGGQPLPTSSEIRMKRSASCYTDDQEKKIRRADENRDLQKMYENLNAKPLSKMAEQLFHRKFTKRRAK